MLFSQERDLLHVLLYSEIILLMLFQSPRQFRITVHLFRGIRKKGGRVGCEFRSRA